jgi:hypothetical protein
MNDLIERLEKKLRFESVETGLVKDAITALREQEIHIEDCSKRNETDADRIAELETNLDYYRKKTEYLLRLGQVNERHLLIELDTFQARIAELESELKEWRQECAWVHNGIKPNEGG